MFPKYCIIGLVLCVSMTASVTRESVDLIVETQNGKILGHILRSEKGREYYSFQEIPYATPPIGDFRFKEPKEPSNWNEVINVIESVKVCMQGPGSTERTGFNVTEDCLYLNVYTPQKPGTNGTLLPVLFWIHGGGHVYGSGTLGYYDPKYFMDYDIIIVSMNYRLGVFGFLTTEDGVIPGNLGLKDQLLALKWAVKNIHLFGGNSSRITIMGESAGASSVGYLINSPQANGLFQAAIQQSGSSLCSFSFQDKPRQYAYKLGELLDSGFTSDSSSTALLTLLKTASASDLLEKGVMVGEAIPLIRGGLFWLPVVENKNDVSAFITTPMHEEFIAGHFNKVPILIGFNSEEAITFLDGGPQYVIDKSKQLDENNSSVIIISSLNVPNENRTAAITQLKKLYTTTFVSNYTAVAKFLSDEAFTICTIRQAELSALHNVPVYMYQFSYKGPMGRLNITIPGVPGVGHAEDLKYMWGGTEGTPHITGFPSADILTHSRLMKIWTNFVIHHNPTPSEDALLENVTWPTVTSDTLQYLNISETLEVHTNPRQYKQLKEILQKYITTPLNIF